jgi:hypothetical protein
MIDKNINTSKLTAYIDLHAQKLRIDLQAARLFVGTTDIGSVAENALRGFLQSNLPAKYSVGVGEAIAPDGQLPQRIEQSQQKDVLLYDPYGCAIYSWGDNGIGLFPVESIYGVIEVKTSINSTDSFLKAIDQTLEVKKLCRNHRAQDQTSPFTGVFVFESSVNGNTLFDALKSRSPKDRADFVFILNPKSNDVSSQGNSSYFTHWQYHSRGGGQINFISADQAASKRANKPIDPDERLTFCETERALLWFYLFLIQQLDGMKLTQPNLWQYANANKERLGWHDNE